MWLQKVTKGGIDGLAYSGDGRTLFVAERGGVFTAWDTVTREPNLLFRIVDYELWYIRGIVLTADERYLIVRGHPAPIVWDCTSLSRRRTVTIPNHPEDPVPLPGVEDALLIRSLDRRSLLAWRPSSKEPSYPFAGPFPVNIRAYAVAPAAQTIAIAGDASREVLLFGTTPGVQARATPEMLSGQAWGVRFAPDGLTLAAFCGRQLHLWDVNSLTQRGKPINIDNADGEGAFAFHPTAPVFIALNADKTLTLFSTETGEAIRSLDFALGQKVKCVCFSPDGLTCAVGGSNKQFAVFDVDV